MKKAERNIKYIVALGSNLGNRYNNLIECTLLISKYFDIINISSIYETKALLHHNAPNTWNKPFLNCVISISVPTNFLPLQVLKIFQDIELELGRAEKFAKPSVGVSKLNCAPRVIDIDIILAENISYNSDILHIPHKRFLSRDFVIVPMQEIENDFYINVLEQYVRDITLHNVDKNIIRKFK